MYTLLALTLLLLPPQTKAAELIVNGGFGTGSFNGWTAVNAAGSWRTWTVSGSGAGGDSNGTDGWTVPDETHVQQGTRIAWHGVTANSNGQFTLTQDVVLPAATNIRMTWIDRYQMNYTQFCSTGCGTATYAVEILNTSNTLLQTLYTVTTPTNTNTNTGYVTHIANLTPYAGQTVRLRFRTHVTTTLQGPGQLEIDAVSVQTLQPTAAAVSVGGRVLSSIGAGISKASVSITDAGGNTRTTLTNPFGYYSFDEIAAGSTYILSVSHKQYVFAESPRVVTVEDSLSDADFRAAP